MNNWFSTRSTRWCHMIFFSTKISFDIDVYGLLLFFNETPGSGGTTYLMGRQFRLITDQRSVSFMFNTRITSKVKNEKIQRLWDSLQTRKAKWSSGCIFSSMLSYYRFNAPETESFTKPYVTPVRHVFTTRSRARTWPIPWMKLGRYYRLVGFAQ